MGKRSLNANPEPLGLAQAQDIHTIFASLSVSLLTSGSFFIFSANRLTSELIGHSTYATDRPALIA